MNSMPKPAPCGLVTACAAAFPSASCACVWRVGASARVQSDISNIRSGFASVSQPGYGVANLVVGWRVNKDLDLQLNVNNLFDRYYYRAVASPVHGNLFGNPRNAQLTARYQF